MEEPTPRGIGKNLSREFVLDDADNHLKHEAADYTADDGIQWGTHIGIFQQIWRPQGESNPCFSLERAAS